MPRGGRCPRGPAAVYRLVLTYRRDNQAFDPGSQVLRQGGASGPEQVVIDVAVRTDDVGSSSILYPWAESLS